jgi:hypothetical protein
LARKLFPARSASFMPLRSCAVSIHDVASVPGVEVRSNGHNSVSWLVFVRRASGSYIVDPETRRGRV